MFDNLSICRLRFGHLASNCLLSCGYLVPAFILPVHIYILYYFWYDYGREVDKLLCSCSCWDTVFKGSYESGVAAYKHVYFNATQNATKMWILTIAFVISLYECFKMLIWLALNCQLRVSMSLLFVSSLFPHYYTWWCYMNYYNDEYYTQWYHQIFFSITEILSSCMVLHLCNKSNVFTGPKLAFVILIGLVHVIAASLDQFVSNVIQGEGYSHQVVRDLGFMIPDVLHVAIPSFQMHKLYKTWARTSSMSMTSLPKLKPSALHTPHSQPNVILKISVMFILAFAILCSI